MTRYAVISDIHGNLPAFQAVLGRIAEVGVDRIICLGDIVGYGPRPAACLELVARHCHDVVRGNHEEALLDPRISAGFNGAARAAIAWTARRLTPAHRRWVSDLPAMIESGPDGSVLCVHDSPVPGPTDYVHDRAVAAVAFRGVNTPVCLVGHTHVPVIFETGDPDPSTPLTASNLIRHRVNDGTPIELESTSRAICNPGSVGQPRDGDARASFATIDFLPGDRRAFTVHRVMYDVDAARRELEAAGLPGVLGERLAIGA
jgi:diadenosine tetraphosphatase ApaH/serine/threonine PP2A family protein phosphatase